MAPKPDPSPTPSRGVIVARLAGIELNLDPSWFLSLALLSWVSHGLIVTDIVHTPEPTPRAILLSLGFGLAISACIVVHEFAHAMAARAYGMRVRRITLFMFGGVAQIEHEAPRPSAEFAVALAGPMASIVLASLFAGLAILTGADLRREPGALGMLSVLNVVVAVFNMAPAFPMDGGRLLRSILWALMGQRARATRYAVMGGRAFGVLLVGWGLVVLGRSAFGEFSGAYTVMIGVFLYSAAGSAGRLEGGEKPNQPSRRPLPVPGIAVEPEDGPNVLTGGRTPEP